MICKGLGHLSKLETFSVVRCQLLRPGKYLNVLILTVGSYFIEDFRQEQDLKQLVTVSFALPNLCRYCNNNKTDIRS